MSMVRRQSSVSNALSEHSGSAPETLNVEDRKLEDVLRQKRLAKLTALLGTGYEKDLTKLLDEIKVDGNSKSQQKVAKLLGLDEKTPVTPPSPMSVRTSTQALPRSNSKDKKPTGLLKSRAGTAPAATDSAKGSIRSKNKLLAAA